MNHSASTFRSLTQLTRPLLSTGVAAVTAAVHVYYRHAVDTGMLGAAAGVFLLSCAASAFNQYQERVADALMERTRHRPFPGGAPWVGIVPAVAIGTGIAGLLLLYNGGRVAAILGFAAVVVYNGIYTFMKPRTPFALLPGAIAGAMPALIGCAAATGRIDGKALFIAGFAFAWQIPHFLLLSMRFTDDYQRAGIRALSHVIPASRLRIITALWTLAACAAVVLFPMAGVVDSAALVAVLLVSTVLVAAMVIRRTMRQAGSVPGWVLHAYQGVVLATIALQGMANR